MVLHVIYSNNIACLIDRERNGLGTMGKQRLIRHSPSPGNLQSRWRDPDAGSSGEVSRRNMDPTCPLFFNQGVNFLLKVEVKDTCRIRKGS